VIIERHGRPVVALVGLEDLARIVFLAGMGFAARLVGRGFRWYAYGTIAAMALFAAPVGLTRHRFVHPPSPAATGAGTLTTRDPPRRRIQRDRRRDHVLQLRQPAGRVRVAGAVRQMKTVCRRFTVVRSFGAPGTGE
jgi:apolipoprotein N-acyltransferase